MERDDVVSISQVFAQQFANRRATRLVSSFGQARIEIELGGDAVERYEKGEDVDHQCAFHSCRSANSFVITAKDACGKLWLPRERLVSQINRDRKASQVLFPS
jgi:hypothetical protein